jgi:hypothetical protein
MSKYFDDDRKQINPDGIPFTKPGLRITYERDDQAGEEGILCNLTRIEQHGEEESLCDAYEPKASGNW